MINTAYKTLIRIVEMTIIVMITFGILLNVPHSEKEKEKIKEKVLFPEVLGDAILKNNKTGISYIKDIVAYDRFEGYIIQGYRADYRGINGTMTIFIAQMLDNLSAKKALMDMARRNGYDENVSNNSGSIITRLPVENPIVFVIQKDKKMLWHYTFAKDDKVYWVGFSHPDTGYQLNMLIDTYRKVDTWK